MLNKCRLKLFTGTELLFGAGKRFSKLRNGKIEIIEIILVEN